MADQLGSIVAVTNGAGAATAINTYDEYGAPGASNTGRFGYTGQAWLPEAQLYHFKARAYLPALGRFAQTDPAGFAGGMNLYAYVANDPVNWTDPSGLAPEMTYNPAVECISDCGNAPIIVTAQTMSFADRMMWEEYLQHYASTHSYFYFYDETHEAEERGREAEEEEIVVTCLRGANGQCVASGHADDATFDAFSLFFPELKGFGVVDDIFRGLCGCFVEGTLVAAPEGLRAIEDIAVGDSVLAWNPETGETTTQTVTALIRPEPKLIWRLEARDAGGETETFEVTDDHPWYVEGAGWVETQNLRPGQRLETADDRGLMILDIARTDRVERTYNLEVDGPHTFFVGEDGAVVHNCELLARIYGNVASRLTHIFRPSHNLGGLVTHFGSREAALMAIHRNAQSLAGRGITTGNIYVNGVRVTVRGATGSDGVFRVGTAYIPGG